MSAATFLFHDGCPICLDVADTFSSIIKLVEIIDLSKNPERTASAEALGVKVLPSIVIDGKVFPLNPHSSLAEQH